MVSTFSGRKPHSKIKQTAKRNSYLTPAGTTNVLRFEVAQSDHVRLKSLSCCFLKEWVRFDSWVVTRSPLIGKRILIGKTIYFNPNLHCYRACCVRNSLMQQSLISDSCIPQRQEKTTSNLATAQWACPNSCPSLWQTIPPRNQSVLLGLRRPRSRSHRALVTCSQTAPKMWQWPSVPISPRLIQHSTYLAKSRKSSWEKHKTRLDFINCNIRNIIMAFKAIVCFDWLIDVLFIRLFRPDSPLVENVLSLCLFMCLTFFSAFNWKDWEAVHLCCIRDLCNWLMSQYLSRSNRRNLSPHSDQ